MKPAEIKDLLQTLINARAVVKLFVERDAPSLQVPKKCREGVVILRVGYGLTPPIIPLYFSSLALKANLHFDGQKFLCYIPWTSIIGMVDEVTGNVYNTASGEQQRRFAPISSDPAPAQPAPKGRHLTLVP